MRSGIVVLFLRTYEEPEAGTFYRGPTSGSEIFNIPDHALVAVLTAQTPDMLAIFHIIELLVSHTCNVWGARAQHASSRYGKDGRSMRMRQWGARLPII